MSRTGGSVRPDSKGVVERVADIEKSLDIYDLSKFTPT
jgi:hypothetical protein